MVTPPTIALRQNTLATLAWVSVASGSTSATLTFDASAQAVGETTLTLESTSNGALVLTETLKIVVYDLVRAVALVATVPGKLPR